MLISRIYRFAAGAAAVSAAVLLAVFSAAGAYADDDVDRSFNNILIFGDSLLDSGNVVNGGVTLVFTDPAEGLQTGGVPAPGQVVSDYFADRLGLAADPSRDGGSNHAVAGYNTEHIYAAVTAYVAGNRVDDKSLVFINGGGNNLTVATNILVGGGFGLPAQAQAAAYLQGAAGTLNVAMGALTQAGAKYIIAGNLPNVALTPGTYASGCAGAFSPTPFCLGAYASLSTTAKGLADGYNTALIAGINTLRNAGANVAVADTYALLDHVIANPAAYGYDASLGQALYLSCYDYDPAALTGDPACAENPTHGRLNGTNPDPEALLFADNVHPTQKFHALNADYLHDMVYAPTEVALLPEIGIYSLRHQMDSVIRHLRAPGGADAERPDCFAHAAFSRDGLGQNGPAAQGDISANYLTAGCGRDLGEQYRYGFAAHLSDGALDISGRDSEYDLIGAGLSGYAGYVNRPLFLNGIFAASYTDINAERIYPVGDGRFSAEGDTAASAWGAEVIGGWETFAASAPWQLAPAVAWSHRASRAAGYTEKGDGISTYRWNNLENASTQYRAGAIASYQAAGNLIFRAEAFYTRELNNDYQDVEITAVSDSANRYLMPGFQRNDEAFEQLRFNVAQTLPGGEVSATWDYSGQGRESHYLQLNFRRVF